MKKLRVMLVDDSRAFLTAAKALLVTVPEAECVAAVESAEAALRKIPSLLPELVLMDLMMPGMNGIDAAREISTLKDAPWVVLVTLHDAAEYRTAALKNGAHGLISKKDFATEVPGLIARLVSGDPSPFQSIEMPK